VVIANGANGNITLTPDGTGDVILSADRVQIGDSNTDTTLTTNGTGSLNLTTNNGSNSGTIQLAQGINGNITLTPNGTGSVSISKLYSSGNTILGATSANTLSVAATITSNLLFTDATYDIGASGATRPRDLFLSRNLTVGGTLTLTGGVNLNGNVTVGDASTDTLTINSTITSNLIFTDNTYDIGASGATRPRTLYLGTSLITPAITNSGLTAGRITYATTGGLLTDSANLTFTSGVLTVSNTGGRSVSATGTSALFASNGAAHSLIIGDNNYAYFQFATTASPTYLAFQYNAAEKMRLDSSGAGILGLGVVNNTWYATFNAFQFGGKGSSVFGRSENNSAAMGSNMYVNAAGNNTYINTDTASYYQQLNGAHTWYTAVSGTANTSITFTQPMTLDASGNLGIGTTSPTARLEVVYASTAVAKFGGPANATVSFSGTGYVSGKIQCGAELNFGSTNSYPVVFVTNNSERVRIDTSGNVGIGNTSPPTGVRLTSTAPSASGYNLFLEQNNGLDGYLLACTSNDGDLVFSRRDTSGTVNTERARLTSAGFLLVGTTVNTNSYYAVVLNDIAIRTATDASGSTNLRLGVSSSMPQGIALLNGTKTAVGGGDMIFNTATGGVLAEKMRLTGAGLVGIGTSSPSSVLYVTGGTNDQLLRVGNTNAVGTQYISIFANGAEAQYNSVNTQNAVYGSHIFTSQNNGGTVERAKIDSSGNFIIGTGSESGAFTVRNASASKSTGTFIATNTSGPNYAIDAVSYASAANTPALIRGYSGSASPTQVFNLSGFGNITQFGGQIFFPATQSASTDANCLDDYEEGTWTVGLRGASTAGTYVLTAVGTYTKIGNVVTVTATISAITVSSAGTGYAQITGLPFTKIGNTLPQGAVYFNSVTFATLTDYVTWSPISESSTAIWYFPNMKSGSASANQDISGFTSASSAYFSATYTTS
jgi:hypothetical protein